METGKKELFKDLENLLEKHKACLSAKVDNGIPVIVLFWKNERINLGVDVYYNDLEPHYKDSE